MEDLLSLEPVDLGRALAKRPLDELLKALRELPWPEAGKTVNGPASAFQVNCGSLRATDPSKAHDEESAGTLSGVKNGKWYACVQSEHYAPYVEASKKWHAERLDQVVRTLDENKDYDMARYLVVSDLSEAVRMYKSSALSCGPLNFLHIQHVSYKQPISDSLDGFEELDFTVDVESGLAGFFDLDWFLSKHPAPAPGPFSLAWFEDVEQEDAYSVEPVWQKFYDHICEITLESTRFGTCDEAAIAYATNGGYRCFAKRDEHGEIICARMMFDGK